MQGTLRTRPPPGSLVFQPRMGRNWGHTLCKIWARGVEPGELGRSSAVARSHSHFLASCLLAAGDHHQAKGWLQDRWADQAQPLQGFLWLVSGRFQVWSIKHGPGRRVLRGGDGKGRGLI